MKKRAGVALLFTTLLPAAAMAADLGGYGTTLFRFQQQSAPGTARKNLAPATQYLGLDAGGLADGNLSFHLYGWGRVDLGDESLVDGKKAGDVSYGYLEYRFPKANGQLKAGRFLVAEGVANEQVDGLGARADLPANFALSLYAGAPAAMDVDHDARGDYLGGGRLSYRLAGIGEIGVSALHAGKSSTQEAVAGTLLTVRNHRQLIGGDIRLAPLPFLELNGRTSYNSVTSSLAEHDYTLTLKPAPIATVTGFFSERRMKGLYAGTNLPALFAPDADDKVRTYGASVTLAAAKPLELVADYRHTRRDTYGGSDRYGVEARGSFLDRKLLAGLGYHRVDAADIVVPVSPTYSYGLSHHEIRGWVSGTMDKYSASLDAIGHFYDDRHNPNLYGRSSAYELVASVGYRLLPNLALSGDVSYGANPLYTNEFKGLVRAEYSFSATAKGGSK